MLATNLKPIHKDLNGISIVIGSRYRYKRTVYYHEDEQFRLPVLTNNIKIDFITILSYKHNTKRHFSI